jgi:TonB family protein
MNRLPDPPADRARPRPTHGLHAILALGACALWGACAPDGPIELPQPMPGDSPVVYPLELWDARVEGETILMIHVTETGAVDSAHIDRSSGLEEFDSAAIRGSRLMRFTPGARGGERRPMWTRLPVRFRREPANPASLSPNGARQ